MMIPVTSTITMAALIAALVDSATDVLALIAALAAALAGIAYIIRLLRAGVRKLDDLAALPEQLESMAAQRQADRDENESAHSEMLGAVTALGAQFDRLDRRLDDIEKHARLDVGEHVHALTRELDVPVRRRRDDAV